MKNSLLTLAAVSAFGLSVSACAMNDNAQQPMGRHHGMHNGMNNAMANPNNIAPVPAITTSVEMTHRMQTLQTGMLAMETSKVALTRATNPLVKEFAQFEIDEQTIIADVINGMYPNAEPVTLNEENARKLQMLKDTPARQFDKAYVKGQIEGHQTLFAVQNVYIDNGRNREEMNVAKLARGQIKQHIIVLKSFQKHMK